jgi:hypothetical protein
MMALTSESSELDGAWDEIGESKWLRKRKKKVARKPQRVVSNPRI